MIGMKNFQKKIGIAHYCYLFDKSFKISCSSKQLSKIGQPKFDVKI